MKKKILDYIMHSDLTGPIFWKLWFRYGIRQAMKEQKRKQAEDAKRPRLTNDEYWDMVHEKQNKGNDERMTELIIYNILFWVPYIWVCSLPAKLIQQAIDNTE